MDISPAMIAVARRKAETLDPADVITWQVADAVPAPVESVDLALCASALHQYIVQARQPVHSSYPQPG